MRAHQLALSISWALPERVTLNFQAFNRPRVLTVAATAASAAKTAAAVAAAALLFIRFLAKIVIIIHDDLFILVNSEISTIYLISFFFALYSVC